MDELVGDVKYHLGTYSEVGTQNPQPYCYHLPAEAGSLDKTLPVGPIRRLKPETRNTKSCPRHPQQETQHETILRLFFMRFPQEL